RRGGTQNHRREATCRGTDTDPFAFADIRLRGHEPCNGRDIAGPGAPSGCVIRVGAGTIIFSPPSFGPAIPPAHESYSDPAASRKRNRLCPHAIGAHRWAVAR